MAARNAHLIKMKILSERALKEDIKREELAAQGHNGKEINEIIQNIRMENYRKPLGTHPMDEEGKVVKILDTTNIGLSDTHLIKTTAQLFNARADKKMDKVKDKKQKEREKTKLGNTLDNAHGTEKESSEAKFKKTHKKNAQQEIDKAIKEQNFRDHIFEMHKGTDTLNKQPNASHYAEQFVFDGPMQELCDNTNFDHHQLKNDLKWYTEAYMKYKITMRK